jgi:hypothetical protein
MISVSVKKLSACRLALKHHQPDKRLGIIILLIAGSGNISGWLQKAIFHSEIRMNIGKECE